MFSMIYIIQNFKKGFNMKSTMVRNIDEKIWHKFRMKCLEKKVSANQKIKELIKAWVKK